MLPCRISRVQYTDKLCHSICSITIKVFHAIVYKRCSKIVDYSASHLQRVFVLNTRLNKFLRTLSSLL